MSIETMRRVLFGALACAPALHAGCREPEAPTVALPSPENSGRAPAPEPSSIAPTPSASPSATGPSPIEPVAPVPSMTSLSTPSPSATGPATAEPPGAKPPGCTTTSSYCLAPRTQPPSFGNVPYMPSRPDPTPYDARGCAPRSAVPTSCSGMTLISGPSLKKGQCCYEVCRGPVPPCGRPFVIEGSSRVAALVARDDWSSGEPTGRADGHNALSTADRARLRDLWLADAAMEHASIASFARLSLELLALGAPPELLQGAHQAALDEIEHAQACFGLATRFATSLDADLSETPAVVPSRGPGMLSLHGMTFAGTLEELVVGTMREGCVGETHAALEASRALEACEDPTTREVLTTIARDELQHAALAFRVVAWAIEIGGASVRAAAEGAYSVARRERLESASSQREAEPAPQASSFARFGRLDRIESLWVVRDAVTALLDPTVERLLARREPNVAGEGNFNGFSDIGSLDTGARASIV